MKRKLCIILVLCILAGMLLPAAAFAEGDPGLYILAQNITFKDSVYLMYAVSGNSTDGVKLLIWTEPQEEYVLGTQAATLETTVSQTVGGKDCKVFTFKDMTAKQMTDDVYARAYVTVGGTTYYSQMVKYSILEYAYNKLGKTGTASTNTKLLKLLDLMLKYGAAAQEYYNDGEGYHLERLATDTFYKVETVGGTMADLSTTGMFKAGQQLVLTAPAKTADGKAFKCWKNSAGEELSYTGTVTVTVPAKNETYTAVYDVAPSEGLEIEVDEDTNECYIVGIGDCTDTQIVIPASYEGKPVVGIDGSAFAGESIKSIKIPATITSVGAKAFNNCSSLTDVYYDGTSEQWDEVDIGRNNTPLANATIHFAKYIVSFTDYDDSVLKKEIVDAGGSATAPVASRPGYNFVSWDKPFTNINADMVVKAIYEKGSTEPAITVTSATAAAGAEGVQIKVALENNPGFVSMNLVINYDDTALTLTDAKTAIAGYTFTAPKNKQSGCKAAWVSTDVPEGEKDGDVLTLTFAVKSTAQAGSHSISVGCDSGNTFDGDGIGISFKSGSGSIVIG